MTIQEKFLVDFHNDLKEVKPEDRKTYIQGYGKLLKLREDAARLEELQNWLALAKSWGEKENIWGPYNLLNERISWLNSQIEGSKSDE